MPKRKPLAPGSPRSRAGQRRRNRRPWQPRATSGRAPVASARSDGRQAASENKSGVWLFGIHAVLAALGNPRRRCRRLLLLPDVGHRMGERLAELLQAGREVPEAEYCSRDQIAAALPESVVHQGVALLADGLDQPGLDDLTDGPLADDAVVVALDRVSDPQNVGAVLRTAAAFGAVAVLTTKHHAPSETGALAKAASGAFEHVPYLRIPNLVRGLAVLKQSGFWCLGLSADAQDRLPEAPPRGRVVLVFGAEGSGLRRLTREHCDQMVRVPVRGPINALNVSNAAAIALYELLGRRQR